MPRKNNNVHAMHVSKRAPPGRHRIWPIMLLMSTGGIGLGAGCRRVADPAAVGAPALPPDAGALAAELLHPVFTEDPPELLAHRLLLPEAPPPPERAAWWIRYVGKW